jgi:hypothetical protein
MLHIDIFFMASAACESPFSACSVFCSASRAMSSCRLHSCHDVDTLQQALSYLQTLLPRLALRRVKVVCRPGAHT